MDKIIPVILAGLILTATYLACAQLLAQSLSESEQGQAWLTKLKHIKLRYPQRALWALLIGLFMLGHAAVTHASTPTPIPPTSTPVALDIPINIVMSSTNGWISTFAPIAAIGIGIAIALAILAWLGKMIKGAFA